MHKYSPTVLQICSYYVGTRLYQNLFDALDAHGLSEDIYVFTHDQSLDVDIPPNVYLSECYKRWERYIFTLKHRRVLADIKAKINLTQYSVLHSHSLFSNGYIAFRLNQEFNVPYMVAVRNTDINVFFRKMIHLRPLGVRILEHAERVIFISKSYMEYAIERFVPSQLQKSVAQKSIVIPNGINTFWLENKFHDRPQLDPSNVQIIYVGDINTNKNIVTTIKACEILQNEGFNVSYKMVGKIKNKRYEELIARHPFIIHIPYCDKEELIRHYREADIFIMPSRHETFGLVYAEAMTQGLPIIYSRGQGFDGQFAEGVVGYSVHHDSPQEIARKVIDILSNYDTISASCLEKSARFNWTQIAQEYLSLYHQMENR